MTRPQPCAGYALLRRRIAACARKMHATPPRSFCAPLRNTYRYKFTRHAITLRINVTRITLAYFESRIFLAHNMINGMLGAIFRVYSDEIFLKLLTASLVN